MEIRTRHQPTQENQNLRLKFQELERNLIALEDIVHPESFGKAPPSTSSLSDPSITINSLNGKIKLGIQEVEALIPLERDIAKRTLAKKRLETFCQRQTRLETKGRDKKEKWVILADKNLHRNRLFTNNFDDDPEALNEGAKENDSLKHSQKKVDESVEIGKYILSSLGMQSESLKRVGSRVEDVAGSLGLSNSLLRAVKRREWGDAMIVYGGMFSVVVILFLFYRWVHQTG